MGDNAFYVRDNLERGEKLERLHFIGRLFKHNSYDKFFSSYVFSAVERPDGKRQKNVRLYVGPLYSQELGSRQAIVRRVVYALLYCTAVILYYLAMALDASSNRNIYVLCSALPAFVFHCLLFLAVPTYVISGTQMKDHEYRDGAKAILRNCIPAAVLTLLPIISGIIMLAMLPNSYSFSELLKMGMLCISSACMLLLNHLETKVIYTFIPPSEKHLREKKMTEYQYYSEEEPQDV